MTFSFEPTLVPTSGKVKISYAGTAGELYLSENGTLTKITEQEFPANGISNMVFKLHGHTPSTENEKDTITITHLGSGATDQICATSVKFDFSIVSEVPNRGNSNSDLTDNHCSELTIHTRPKNIDFSQFDISFCSKPLETNNIVNNRKGTNISFFQQPELYLFKTSRIYWYGVSPKNECFFYDSSYYITMKIKDASILTKKYNVNWPIEDPYMLPNSVSRQSPSKISDPFPLEKTLPDGTIETNYLCKIIFADFLKSGILCNLPTTDQYFEETQKEEEFHLKQWLGQVSSEKGGQGDCFTAKGIRYFAEQTASLINAKIVVTSNSFFVINSSKNIVKETAEYILEEAERLEYEESSKINYEDYGFREKQAKEYAGYNAAFRYHCTYEKTYGSNPTNHIHRAFLP